MSKSPSGSLCPYYYMGGELHPLKYGSCFDNKEKLFSLIKAEEDFILSSSGQNNRRIWIDLYETTLNDEVIHKIVAHINMISPKIYRLCFVGCSYWNRRKIKNIMAINNVNILNGVRFFSDPEKAKQWLIGKIH